MTCLNGTTKALLLTALMLLSAAFVLQGASSTALAVPYSGSPPTPTNLTAYFHNVSTPVTIGASQALDIANTLNDSVAPYSYTGSNITSTHYIYLSFSLYPQLTAPLVLNGSVNIWFYFSQHGSTTNGGSITASVDELSPSGTTTSIGSGSPFAMKSGDPGSAPTSVLLSGPTFNNVVVPANYSLVFNVSLTGNSATTYSAYWGFTNSTHYYSRAVVSASSYLEISNTYAVNGSGQIVHSLPPNATNKNVTFYANITDPLGAYDFASWPVQVNIRNSTSVEIMAGSMTPVTPVSFNSAYVLFSFKFNYSSFAVGSYVITANATDNTMHNFVTASGVLYGRNAYGSMQLFVGLPPVHALFTVQDSQGNMLRGAVVRAFYSSSFVASNRTNSSGIAGISLFGGNYTIRVFWQSTEVGAFALDVNNTSNAFTLRSDVYSPTYIFGSMSGMPLTDAFVYMKSPNGTELPLIVTGIDGAYPMSEMAGGNYSTVVVWHSSIVFNGSIDLNSNGNVPVDVNAYTQSFRVVSASGGSVPTASILVVNATTGIYIGFNTTDASGMTSAVIPYGTYAVSVYWKGILVYHIGSVALDNPTAPAMVLNSSIYTVTVRAVSASGEGLGNVVVNVYSNSTGTFLSAVTDSSGYASFVLAGGSYTVTASFSTTYDLTPVYQKITRSIAVSGSSALSLKFTHVYPPITSTNLFYFIVAIVAIAIIAVAVVAVIVRKGGMPGRSGKKDGK